jgi:hypothetical protein
MKHLDQILDVTKCAKLVLQAIATVFFMGYGLCVFEVGKSLLHSKWNEPATLPNLFKFSHSFQWWRSYGTRYQSGPFPFD